MSNMSGMQKCAANKLLQKKNIPMPMLLKQNTYAHERIYLCKEVSVDGMFVI